MVANILVISELKPEVAYDPHCFQMTRVTIIQNFEEVRLLLSRALIIVCNSTFLFLNENFSCRYSKEPSQWNNSFEHPQIFKILRSKIVFILTYLLCWVWLKWVKTDIVRERWVFVSVCWQLWAWSTFQIRQSVRSRKLTAKTFTCQWHRKSEKIKN